MSVGDLTMELRRAEPTDADDVADVWLRSRRAAIPSIPAPVHDDDAVRGWFRDVVLAHRDVWVAVDTERSVLGVLVMADGWIDQLYVDPGSWGQGLGSALIDLAKQQSPEGLELWTFQRNAGARRLYERHEFVATEMTDGSGNEERTPDVRLRWTRAREAGELGRDGPAQS